MNKKIKILFLWQPPDELLSYLKSGLSEVSNFEFYIIGKDTAEEDIKKYYLSSDIIIGWRPNEKYLKEAENVKLFINPGAGVKHLMAILREINLQRKLVLVNGHGNAYFTAQHGVALLLSLMNKITLHHNWMKDGKWRLGDKEATSIPLRNKKIGLLGYGAINKNVHKFLSGFDVELHILKRSWIKDEGTENKYLPVQLNEFLKAIDILIIAVPDTNETNNLIGATELKLLGENGLIVNIARGEVINQESLYRALKNNLIAGAALDVWYEYSPEENKEGEKFPYDAVKYPFHELDNVILSPHRAASPLNDLSRWNEVIENITRFSQGRKDFLNIVDIEKGY